MDDNTLLAKTLLSGGYTWEKVNEIIGKIQEVPGVKPLPFIERLRADALNVRPAKRKKYQKHPVSVDDDYMKLVNFLQSHGPATRGQCERALDRAAASIEQMAFVARKNGYDVTKEEKQHPGGVGFKYVFTCRRPD
jgi:hypothetical protein